MKKKKDAQLDDKLQFVLSPTKNNVGYNIISVIYDNCKPINATLDVIGDDPNIVTVLFVNKDDGLLLHKHNMTKGDPLNLSIYDSKYRNNGAYIPIINNLMIISFDSEYATLGEDGIHKEYLNIEAVNEHMIILCEVIKFDYVFNSVDEFNSKKEEIYVLNDFNLANKKFLFSDELHNDRKASILGGGYDFNFYDDRLISLPEIIAIRSLPGSDNQILYGFISKTPLSESDTYSKIKEIGHKIFYYLAPKQINGLQGPFMLLSINSIPSDIFINLTNIMILSRVFSKTTITSIPHDIFYNLKNVAYVNSNYIDCDSLTSLPGKIYKNMSKLEDINREFSGLKNITSLPDDILYVESHISDANNRVEFNSILEDSSIESIPDSLFDSFDYCGGERCFENSTSLRNISDILFDKILDKFTLTNLSEGEQLYWSFNYFFSNCINLEGRIPIENERLAKLVEISDHSTHMFYNCFKMKNRYIVDYDLGEIDNISAELEFKIKNNYIQCNQYVGESKNVELGVEIIDKMNRGVDFEFLLKSDESIKDYSDAYKVNTKINYVYPRFSEHDTPTSHGLIYEDLRTRQSIYNRPYEDWELYIKLTDQPVKFTLKNPFKLIFNNYSGLNENYRNPNVFINNFLIILLIPAIGDDIADEFNSNYDLDTHSALYHSVYVDYIRAFHYTALNNYDYIFNSVDEFKQRIQTIINDNSGDLSNIIIKFSDSVTDISGIFKDSDIIKAPKAIVGDNITVIDDIFMNCHSLVFVPEYIFARLVRVKSAKNGFANCEKLELAPSYLFKCQYDLEYVDSLFCNSGVRSFYYMDYYDKIVKESDSFYIVRRYIKSMTSMFSGTKLIRIKFGDLYEYSNLCYLVNMSSLCENCLYLESIDFNQETNSGQFASVQYVSRAFYGCKNLKTIPEVYNRVEYSDSPLPKFVEYDGYATGCTNATNYANVPTGWK